MSFTWADGRSGPSARRDADALVEPRFGTTAFTQQQPATKLMLPRPVRISMALS